MKMKVTREVRDFWFESCTLHTHISHEMKKTVYRSPQIRNTVLSFL
jgi:hypothetical protein